MIAISSGVSTHNTIDQEPAHTDEQQAIPSSISTIKGKILVIKLGGSTLEHQRPILQDVIKLRALGANPVVVHGGGPYIDQWLEKLHIHPHFEQGLRITDAQTLDVVRMVLRGQINQELVSLTVQMGGKAIGLSGTDGNIVQAHIANEHLGFVGEVDAIHPTLLHRLLKQRYIPIIAPLGQGPDGHCLNINADHVAAQIAGALKADKLIFLSNVPGICRPDGSRIAELSETEARTLITEGVIYGGMIPKVMACLQALQAIPCVHIIDGGERHALLRETGNKQSVGTMIVRDN